MGRRKLEIKRIENNYARQTSFTKRRQGFLKKAKDLSVLCDVDVAAIVVSGRGKLYHYSSTNNLSEILQRYRGHVEIEEDSLKEVCGTQEQYPKSTNESSSGELLQSVERELGEPRLNQLSVADLVQLEKQLEDALNLTRSTKGITFRCEDERMVEKLSNFADTYCIKTHLLLDYLSSLHGKENMLVEEKRHLEEKLAQIKNNGRKNKVLMDLNMLADYQITEQ